MKKETIKIATRDIALVALFVAIIEVFKFAMANLANIEMTSFLLIIFSLYFGKRVYAAVPVFILIEGVIYGFGIWWVMYLYAWPLLAITILLLKKRNNIWDMAMISGIFGLLFGFLCAIPYLFISGLAGAFAYWIAGIPFDLIHCVSNAVLAFILLLPLYNLCSRMLGRPKAN